MYAPPPPGANDQPSSDGYPQYSQFASSYPSDASRDDEVFTSDSEDANWTMIDEKERADSDSLAAMRAEVAKEEMEQVKYRENIASELTGDRVWRSGGIGLWAYSLDATQEDIKKEVWSTWEGRPSKDAWINIARARTKAYNDCE